MKSSSTRVGGHVPLQVDLPGSRCRPSRSLRVVAASPLMSALILASSAIPCSAALQLSIEASPDPVVSGGRIEYRYIVSNTGNSDIPAVVVDTVIPEHTDGATLSLPSTCVSTCDAGDKATWSVGTIPFGQSRVLRLIVTVLSTPTGTSITNHVTASGTGVSTQTADRSVVVEATPQLNVSIQDDFDPPADSGGEIIYGVTLSQQSDLVGSADQTDLHAFAPNGATILEASDNGLITGGNSPMVSWSIASLKPGFATRRSFRIAPAPGLAGGTLLSASAGATGTIAGVQRSASADETTSISTAPALRVQIEANPDPVATLGQLEFRYTITNVTDLDVQLVKLDTVIPSFTDGLRISAGGTCASTCNAGNRVSWALDKIPPHQSRTLWMIVTILSTTPRGTLINNQVILSGQGVSTVTDEQTVAVETVPQLNVALKEDFDASARDDGQLTYSVTLSHQSDAVVSSDATELHAFAPDGAVIVAASDDNEITDGSTPSVSWPIGSLKPGNAVRRTFRIAPEAGLVDGDLLTAVAGASGIISGAPREAAAEETTTVSSQPSLRIQTEASPDPVSVNGTVEFRYTVGNTTDLDILNVRLETVIPTRTDGVTLSAGSVCESTCDAGHRVTWLLASLPAHQTRTFWMVVRVLATAKGTLLRNQITVSGSEVTTVTDEQTVVVESEPNLGVAMSENFDPSAGAAGELSYTVTVSHQSASVESSDATSLRAFAPDGSEIVSVSDNGVVTDGIAPVVSWPIGTLKPGTSMRRSFRVKPEGGAPAGSLLAASATATGTINTIERTAVAEETTSVAASPALRLQTEANPDPVRVGARLEYRYTVSNVRDLEIQNVVLETIIPRSTDGLRISSGGSCASTCNAGNRVTWSLGAIPAGQSRTVWMVVTVLSTANGTILRNRATITGTDVSTITDEQVTVVEAAPDLEIALNDDFDPSTEADGAIRYTVTVSHQSDLVGFADNLSVRGFAPEGAQILSASHGGEITGGAVPMVTWPIATLAPGTATRRTFLALPPDGSAPGTLHSASAIATGTIGGVLRSATAGETTSESTEAALQLETDATPDAVITGDTIVYRYTIRNRNVLPIQNVKLETVIPSFTDGKTFVGGVCESTCDAGHRVSWTFVSIPGGGSQIVELTVKVLTAIKGSLIVNESTVTGEGVSTVSDEQTVVHGSVIGGDIGSCGDLSGGTLVACPIAPAEQLAGDEFGASMALSHEYLVIGAPAPESSSSGRVHVFVPSGDGFVEQTQSTPVALPFQDSVHATGDLDFGASVDVDASTIVVGAPFDVVPVGGTSSFGSASVFVRIGESWTFQQKLLDPTGTCTALGSDVAISGDTIVLGAPAGNCALVFEREAAQWNLAARLDAPVSGVRFGRSVDVSGSEILVGAPGKTADSGCDAQGAVYAYRRNAGAWPLEDTITEPAESGGGACFGAAVGVDGDTGVIGAPYDNTAANDAGAAYVIERSNSQWEITAQLLRFENAAEGDGFGASLDISGDRILVGAPGVAAYLFESSESGAVANRQAFPRFESGKWLSTREIVPPEGLPPVLSKFAFAVAVDADEAAIGAPDEGLDALTRAGAAYPDRIDAGTGTCGDGVVAAGEQCDDGNSLFTPGEDCGVACVKIPCGRPTNSTGALPKTSDALFTLKAAVAQVTCSVKVCDTDANGKITTTDALKILRAAVGQVVTLTCSP
ncbi:MAG TPA: hypothetical protein VN634_00860 [Candidatus Limnocylindrales bacterium]|nr:hypothetical protein [Candidatus Limnocylindrales bacterium]